jgi:hypothetical protein
MCGRPSLCENSLPNSVPQGRLKIDRDAVLDNLQPSLRDQTRKAWFSHTLFSPYINPAELFSLRAHDKVYPGDKSRAYPETEFFRSLFSRALRAERRG